MTQPNAKDFLAVDPIVSVSAPPLVPTTARASQNSEQGRTHGLPFIFWVMEQNILTLLAVPTIVATITMFLSHGGWRVFAATWVAVPLALVVLPIFYLIYRSHSHDAGL